MAKAKATLRVVSYATLPSSKQLTKERREFRQRQLELEAYQDIRDDVMSLVKNSGLTYEDIHARCGPHPTTLEHWAEKKVNQPRLGKMRAVLRIMRKDFGIVDR